MSAERSAPQDQQKFVSKIVVGNKQEIPDPREPALMRQLAQMGVRSVRIGKLFQVTHAAADLTAAHTNAIAIAQHPLANPVYEEVRLVETITPIKTVNLSKENV